VFKAFTSRKVQIFTQTVGAIAGPQTSATDKGQAVEQTCRTHFTQDIMVQEFFFNHSPQWSQFVLISQSLGNQPFK
jgi:hypothetical protein